jgi:hypothetical protein
MTLSRSHRFGAGLGWGRGIWFRVVDSGRIDIDAVLSRDAAFRAASDGANAAGRDGKPGGAPYLWDYSRRRFRYIEAGNSRAHPTFIKTRAAPRLVRVQLGFHERFRKTFAALQ